jgi:hypothetical protein
MATKKPKKKLLRAKEPHPTRKPHREPDILDGLTAEEALKVLRRLTEDDQDISLRALKTAVDLIINIDPEDIALRVLTRLDGLDAEDAYARSGRARDGYLEPEDCAWRMLEEALVPFLKEMRRLQGLGRHPEAQGYCIGILRGIQRFEDADEGSDFKDLTVDAPGTFFNDVLEAWKKGTLDKEIRERMAAQVRSEFPGWAP